MSNKNLMNIDKPRKISHENMNQLEIGGIDDEKSTYEKIEAFFKEHKGLNLTNFEHFIEVTELNTVFQYDDLNAFWALFSNSDKEDAEYDFNTTLEFVEKLGEKYSELKTTRDDSPDQKPLHDTITVEDIPDFLDFLNIALKSRDFIIINDIPNLVKNNRCCLTEEVATNFFNKISHSQVGNLLYINMELYGIAVSRLEQALELDALRKKNNVYNASQSGTGLKLIDEITNTQEESSANLLIIQNMGVDIKVLFDQLLDNYNKIVNVDGNASLIEQINVEIEETFKKLKEIEIGHKKLENYNTQILNYLAPIRDKYFFMENYIDQAEIHKKMTSNQNLIDLSGTDKNKKDKENEYIIKLLKDIENLEETQHNLEQDFNSLKKSEKEKETKLFEVREDNNSNILEIKKLRLEVERLTSKLNTTVEENNVLMKKTYKDIEKREEKKKQNLFKNVREKSGSVSNFDHLLGNNLGATQDDIKERYQKLKKHSTDIEKQKKSLEDDKKDLEEACKMLEELSYKQKQLIKEQMSEINHLKIRIENKDASKTNSPTHSRHSAQNTPTNRGRESNPTSPKDKEHVISGINLVEDDDGSVDEDRKDAKVQEATNISPLKTPLTPSLNLKSLSPSKSPMKDHTVWEDQTLMAIDEANADLEYTQRPGYVDNKGHKPEKTKTTTSLFETMTHNERKVDRITTTSNENTKEAEPKRRLQHHRSQSTIGFTKQTSIFLMLNNEVEDTKDIEAEFNEKKIEGERNMHSFDYFEVSSYDFLHKKNEEKHKKLFDNNNEVFSDNIYLYDTSMTRSKILYEIIVSSKHIYIENPSKDSHESVHKLENLFRISCSKKNYNLLVLHFTQGDDIIINTFRRTAFLSYLRKHYIIPNNKDIKFYYSECIKLQLKSAIKDLVINHTEQNYENCVKVGWLSKYSTGILSNSFVDKFVILTNVGLLYFDEPNQAPKKLVHLAGSNISRVDQSKYKNDLCFEINYLPGEETSIFAAKSEEELNSWIIEITKSRDRYEKRADIVDAVLNDREIIMNEEEKVNRDSKDNKESNENKENKDIKENKDNTESTKVTKEVAEVSPKEKKSTIFNKMEENSLAQKKVEEEKVIPKVVETKEDNFDKNYCQTEVEPELSFPIRTSAETLCSPVKNKKKRRAKEDDLRKSIDNINILLTVEKKIEPKIEPKKEEKPAKKTKYVNVENKPEPTVEKKPGLMKRTRSLLMDSAVSVMSGLSNFTSMFFNNETQPNVTEQNQENNQEKKDAKQIDLFDNKNTQVDDLNELGNTKTFEINLDDKAIKTEINKTFKHKDSFEKSKRKISENKESDNKDKDNLGDTEQDERLLTEDFDETALGFTPMSAENICSPLKKKSNKRRQKNDDIKKSIDNVNILLTQQHEEVAKANLPKKVKKAVHTHARNKSSIFEQASNAFTDLKNILFDAPQKKEEEKEILKETKPKESKPKKPKKVEAPKVNYFIDYVDPVPKKGYQATDTTEEFQERLNTEVTTSIGSSKLGAENAVSPTKKKSSKRRAKDDELRKSIDNTFTLLTQPKTVSAKKSNHVRANSIVVEQPATAFSGLKNLMFDLPSEKLEEKKPEEKKPEERRPEERRPEEKFQERKPEESKFEEKRAEERKPVEVQVEQEVHRHMERLNTEVINTEATEESLGFKQIATENITSPKKKPAKRRTKDDELRKSIDNINILLSNKKDEPAAKTIIPKTVEPQPAPKKLGHARVNSFVVEQPASAFSGLRNRMFDLDRNVFIDNTGLSQQKEIDSSYEIINKPKEEKVDPKVDTKAEPKIVQKAETKIDPKIETKTIETKEESKGQTKTDALYEPSLTEVECPDSPSKKKPTKRRAKNDELRKSIDNINSLLLSTKK